MSILSPEGLAPQSPFCDCADITFPRDHESDVQDIAASRIGGAIGAQVVRPGLWHLQAVRHAVGDGEVGWIFEDRPKPPTVMVKSQGAWCKLVVSGQACEALRLQGLFVPLLADLSAFPYRVTNLHSAVDLPGLPGPEAVPAVAAAGQAGQIALSRKALPPQEVNWSRQIDARGDVTGGVYLGTRGRQEITGFFYDKRNERERAGLADLGPWSRFELRFAKVGATLRDVAEPGALFWNYVGGVLPLPDGVASWRAGDVGWDMPAAPPPDYWRIVERRVDTLADELLDLKRLALNLGPYGPAMLLRRLAAVLGLSHLVLAGSGEVAA